MTSKDETRRPQTREQLIHHLTEAAELEHNILCSYLYAAFSLRLGDPTLSHSEAKAVAGWHGLIMSIAVEEMGHLAIVNNLLVAVGGAPHFDRPNFPVAEGYLPSCFDLRLSAFDEDTLEYFIFLEHPRDSMSQDTAEVASRRLHSTIAATPSATDYSSIAELYAAIRANIQSLVTRHGSKAFATTSVERQITPAIADLPGVTAITDLPSAFAGLDLIIEQGEGAGAESENSHYARFLRIQGEWDRLKIERPSFIPAYPVARNPVMRRPIEGQRVWIRDPKSAAHLDLANAVYAQMLITLEQVYVGGEVRSRKALLNVAMSLMKTLAVLGAQLARMPAGPDFPGTNAGLTFAVPRNLGTRGCEYPTFATERLSELKDQYAAMLAPGQNNSLEDAYAQISTLRSANAP